MNNRPHSTDLETTEEPPTVNHSRRRTLKALGTLAGVSVAGSGTALGAELNALVADRHLTVDQAGRLITQAKKLTASDGDSDDRFGYDVSVSADGTTVLIGALSDEAAGRNTGSAYVYDLTQDPPTETKLTPSDASGEDEFGRSVSVSADGTTALVGASRDTDAAGRGGSVYVYDLTQDPPTETKRIARDTTANDYFGYDVSVNADGTTALVGAPSNDDAGSNSGSAYVYDLTEDPPTETKLLASDATPRAIFGRSVSLSPDGTTALVGAQDGKSADAGAGAAYVYDLTQNPPTETKLTASDSDVASDDFGWAVSVSADGDMALIGARLGEGVRRSSGAAYVYDLTQNPPAETKLTPSDAGGDWNFGWSVSLSSGGTSALIGAPSILPVSGDEENDSTEPEATGTAYLYDLTTDPPAETKLAADDAAADDRFGRSVSLSGNRTIALVGAPQDDDAGRNSGSAYLFDLDSPTPVVGKGAFQFDLALGEVIEDIGESDDAYYGRQGRLVQAVSMLNDGTLTRSYNHPHGDTRTVVKDGCTITYGRFHYDADSGEVSVTVGLAEDCQEKTLTLAGYEFPEGDTMFVRAHADDQELRAYETITVEPGETVTLTIDVDG